MESLQELDLVHERNGRFSDRFFERLMFPICDKSGRPVAYSGRLLPAAERAAKEAGRGVGKYINSTDTPLFKKSHIVFNIHQARLSCRDEGRILIMEGPTDVMAAYQAGRRSCVAVLGTAMTPDHAKQLGNLVGEGEIILLLDGDAAGQRNMLKAVSNCLSVGVATRVAVMPEGQDPAELLSGPEEGIERFDDVINKRRSDVAHVLRALSPRPHDLDQRQRWQATDKLLDVLRPVPDRDLREAYIAEVAQYFNVQEVRLQRRLRDKESNELHSMDAHASDEESDESTAPALTDLQDTLLHILVRFHAMRSLAFDQLHVEPHWFPVPWSHLVQVMIENLDVGFDAMQHDEHIVGAKICVAALFRWQRDEHTQAGVSLAEPEGVLREAALKLHVSLLDKDIARLEHELRDCQLTGQHDEAGRLFRELLEFQNQRRNML